jgi:cytochrome P450
MTAMLDEALTSETFFQSPWDTYKRLRNDAPVYWCEPWHQWLVSRHDDVSYILRSPELFSNHGFEQSFLAMLPGNLAEDYPNIKRHYDTSVVSNSDPPDHTRLRRLLQPIFGPRSIKHWETVVDSLVESLLESISQRGVIDWVQDYAFPLPSTVIAMILGAPPSERERFQRWSSSMIAFLGSGFPQARLAQENDANIGEFRTYMEELARNRSAEDASTVLDALVAARDEGLMSHDELMSTCMTLLQGGFETTANLLGNAMWCILSSPEQWRQLIESPDRAASAVEEVLRFNGPVQRVRRIARKDVVVGETEIPAGSLVVALIGAANRDESQFERAGEFDIGREPGRHLGFGGGIHHCVGAPLSRIEASISLEKIARQYDGTHLSEGFEPRYRRNMAFRGMEHFPIRLERG